MHGKREQIKLIVAALMCGGHALLEDVPGTAKTVLARNLNIRDLFSHTYLLLSKDTIELLEENFSSRGREEETA